MRTSLRLEDSAALSENVGQATEAKLGVASLRGFTYVADYLLLQSTGVSAMHSCMHRTSTLC
jgi:hypothetical protein